MIRPKIPQRAQPNVKLLTKNTSFRKQTIEQGRSISPLTSFTHFNIDETDQPQSCRPLHQKNLIQILTPPLASDSRTLSLAKDNQKKNYSLSYKCLIPSGKKMKSESPIIGYQSQHASYLHTNNNSTTMNNESAVKNKSTKENLGTRYIYGLGQQNQDQAVSKGKFIKLSMKSDDFQNNPILAQISQNQQKTQPFTCEDDKDLYYQIIKQRTQANPQKDQQLKVPISYCQMHSDKRGKFYKKEDNQIIILCSRCAIGDASQQIIIYDLLDHLKITRENQEKQVEESPDQKTKEIQTFLYRTQYTYKMANNLLDVLVTMQNKQNTQIPHLISNYLMEYLRDPVQKYVDMRSSISSVPTDVMGEIQDQINEMLQELVSIKNDINQNMLNIIKNMEMKPFRLILQKYHLKVEAFESNLKELFVALDKNFGLPNLFEMVEILKLQIQNISLKKSPITKQVYISFENKESFNKAKQECQSPPIISQTNDSIILGSSDTQKFLDFLHKEAEDQKIQNPLTRPFEDKNLLLSPKFIDNDQFY